MSDGVSRARPLVVVCVALVDEAGSVLLARRPPGKPMAGLWEFPGGKLMPDETPEAALVREAKEELGIEIAREALVPVTFASHAYDDFHILLLLYLCRSWRGVPSAREGQALAWVAPAAMDDAAMPAADRPLVERLREML